MFDFLTNPDVIKIAIVWFGAACTLGIYSVLYRENKVFRFFEHLFIGLSTGYAIAQTWRSVLLPQWWQPMVDEGRWYWAFALAGGLLFYMIYSKRYAWTSRLIFGLFFGFAGGQQFQAYAGYYFPLFRSAMNVQLVNPPEATAAGAYGLTPVSAVLNNVLYLAILVAVMSYFFFSFEQKNKAVTGTSKMGRYVLMVAFGAIFGSTIMARMSLLIGRMYFLLHDWLTIAR